MKHFLHLTITFLIISIFGGCNKSPNLELHIKNLEKINSDIIPYENIFLKETNKESFIWTQDNREDGAYVRSFNHKIKQSDTIIFLSYNLTIIPDDSNFSGYNEIRFNKSYYKDGKYHMIELSNNDTLFHYSSPKPIEQSRFFVDYEFISGKYYFMASYNSGFFNEQQMIYFFLNVDSLINVRGNNLPELPSIDTISLEDFFDSATYQKIINEKSFFQ